MFVDNRLLALCALCDCILPGAWPKCQRTHPRHSYTPHKSIFSAGHARSLSKLELVKNQSRVVAEGLFIAQLINNPKID